MNNSIFITFNPNVEVEESTALRLQTLSNLYGLRVLLPFRSLTNSTSESETKLRIDQSEIVVAFCIKSLSTRLKSELKYAFDKGKRIVVIYDKAQGAKIHFKSKQNVKEVFADFEKTDDALHEIAVFLRASVQKTGKPIRKKNNENGLEIALIGIGLGLLAAWALSQEQK